MTPELLMAIASICRISFGTGSYYDTMSWIPKEQTSCQQRLIRCAQTAPKGVKPADAVAECVLQTVWR